MHRAGGRQSSRFSGPSVALVLCALLVPSADAQVSPAGGVTHVRIEGPLASGTLPLVHRALSSALVADLILVPALVVLMSPREQKTSFSGHALS